LNSYLKRKKVATAIKLAMLGGLSLGFIGTTLAAEEDDESVEKIQVTGSAIKRSDSEGALPVTTIDRAQIDQSGVQTVTDLIQTLPMMQGFTAPSQSVGGGGGGITTASIHDLGGSYTLVLLNGRRLAPAGSGSTIDINTIPLAAIERVDILSDGASAIYGSDAIAGVVNFITKKDYNGFNINARGASTQNGGADSSSFSLTGGFGDSDADGYNVLVSFSHDSQDPLASKDRDFSKTGFVNGTQNGRDWYYFAGSSNAIAGNANVSWVMPDGTTGSNFFNPYLAANGECAPDNVQYDDYCFFDYTSTLEIYPESERNSLMLNATFDVNQDLRLFANLNFSDTEVVSRIAPYPTGTMNIGADNPLADQYITPFIPDGATITGLSGKWRALPGGNRTTGYATKSTHLVIGGDGVAGDIDYGFGITRSVNDSAQNFKDGWLIEESFINAIKSGEIDIFAPAGTVSPDTIDKYEYAGNWGNSKTVVNAVDAKMSMPLFEMDGGDVYMATGFDYKDTTWESTTSQANKDEIILFFGADDEYSMQRSNYGAFVELALPFNDQLEVTTSYRYDNLGGVDSYDMTDNKWVDVNPDASGETWKIMARYKMSDNLTLRASRATGFKAPSMLQIASPLREAGVTGDNYACPFEAGDSMAQYCIEGLAQYSVYAQGNPDMKNETSKQQSAGFIYAPTANFSIVADYWQVEMSNQVSSLSEAQIFGDPETYRHLFTTKYNSGADRDELAIIQRSVNIGRAKYSGIDFNTAYYTDIGDGRWTSHFSGSYMLDSKATKAGTSNDWVSSMGKFGDFNSVTFRLIANWANTYAHGDFSHTLNMNYRTGYTDQETTVYTDNTYNEAFDIQLDVAAYTKFNWVTEYTINDNLKVAGGINNIFDKEPPMALGSGGSHQVGYDSRYYDALGRTVYLSVDYSF
jgi:iron complex outermembrane recepter protein